jgi:phosphatidylglycerophosphatase A
VGLGWFALLLLTGSWLVFGLCVLASVALSIWLCGEGERILQQKDPGSVVLDEIIAIPICFTGWMALVYFQKHQWPGPHFFFVEHWFSTVIVFALFRLFDVRKPWPVYQSQSLPGGWGITVDDVLAAIYVSLVMLFWLTVAEPRL